MDRLVSIVTSIEALLQGLVSSVNTLVALHQLDVVGLQNLSMRVDEILVRQPPYMRHVLLLSWQGHLMYVSTCSAIASIQFTDFHVSV